MSRFHSFPRHPGESFRPQYATFTQPLIARHHIALRDCCRTSSPVRTRQTSPKTRAVVSSWRGIRRKQWQSGRSASESSGMDWVGESFMRPSSAQCPVCGWYPSCSAAVTRPPRPIPLPESTTPSTTCSPTRPSKSSSCPLRMRLILPSQSGCWRPASMSSSTSRSLPPVSRHSSSERLRRAKGCLHFPSTTGVGMATSRP
jgi:hypothetical protein